jgi:hypothetical protein
VTIRKQATIYYWMRKCDELKKELKEVLAREAATTARYDAKIERLENHLLFWKSEAIAQSEILRELKN